MCVISAPGVAVICSLLFLKSSLVYSFAPQTVTPYRRVASSSVRASKDDNTDDDLRKMLESSWNTKTMGEVPSNPEVAASMAAEAVLEARAGSPKPLYFIDILLPQYDLAQGERMYDEVAAVELCISLSLQLEGKTEIIVREQKTVENVQRVLNARAKKQEKGTESEAVDSEEGVNEDPKIPSPTTDAESFRAQLMSSWDPAEEADDPSAANSDDYTPVQVKGDHYRLTSMLGTTKIKVGPDMTESVLRAVSANAKPTPEEDTMIILSAISPEELLGVRALVGKYKNSMNIIMVNCRLNPVPRELIGGESVYSILPLVAMEKKDEGLFRGESQPSADPTKVVVMRKYPGDWEVHVDIGHGFERATKCPASQFKRIPPLEWIADRVKSFLKAAS